MEYTEKELQDLTSDGVHCKVCGTWIQACGHRKCSGCGEVRWLYDEYCADCLIELAYGTLFAISLGIW